MAARKTKPPRSRSGEEEESGSERAFADLRTDGREVGRCFACGVKNKEGDRVTVRVHASHTTLREPKTGARITKSLASAGRTFCPACARGLFDRIQEILETSYMDKPS